MEHGITVDIWSDIACPWCYIGKRRFEHALQLFATAPSAVPVEVEYHSFELAPETPVDFAGTETDFLERFKRLPRSQVQQMIDHVVEMARAVGLNYDYDKIQHTNSVKAHQVLHHAKAHGVQAEAKERLLRAYWIEGRHIGRDEELAGLAAEVGLDRDDVLRSLQADEHLADVRADQRLAAQLGINAVPFFVIDRHHGIAGAQEPEVFSQVLQRVATERRRSA